MNQQRKGGFTLIEIMVVIALVAIISTITFGSFRSITDGNKRSSCQTNMSQIYQACRLYAQDYNGQFPYFNNSENGRVYIKPATPQGTLGLWALYAFPKPASSDCPSSPNNQYNQDLPLASEDPTNPDAIRFAGYIRSTKSFHCPADDFPKTVQYRDTTAACQSSDVQSASPTFVSSAGTMTYLNPSYLSYQQQDDVSAATDDPDIRSTYSTFRESDNTFTGQHERQLKSFFIDGGGDTHTPTRPADDNTIVLWCRFHRSLDKTGATTSGRRNFDNVLFNDGSVQNLPVQEDTATFGPCDTLSDWRTNTCVGSWRRVPKTN